MKLMLSEVKTPKTETEQELPLFMLVDMFGYPVKDEKLRILNILRELEEEERAIN